jgi:hypothetical protein
VSEKLSTKCLREAQRKARRRELLKKKGIFEEEKERSEDFDAEDKGSE